MLETLGRAYSQAHELWGKVPAAVKWSLLGLVIFVLLYVALLSPLRPGQAAQTLAPLAGQPFPQREANLVVSKLAELQVPFKLGGADGSTILVAPDNMVRARMAVAQAGVPQQPAGLELFDRNNLTQTDFDRKVQLLRAQKGELEKAILQLAWVKTAVVNLSIPEKSVFIREQKPVKAAVMVEPRPGVEVNPREVEGIVRFVSASVPELDTDNVIVIDNTGRTLTQGLNKQAGQPQVTEAGDQLKQQLAYQKSLETALQGMLDRAFGPGNASAMVSVKLAYDSQQQEETRYQGAGPNNQGLLRSEQTGTKTFEGQGTPGTGAPAQGTDANTPNPPVYQAGTGQATGPSSYDEKTRTANYELNQIKTVRMTPPGRVESISVGVLLNRQLLQNATPEVETQIKAAVANAVGAPLNAVTVAPLPFNNELLNAFKPTKAEESPPAALATAVDWRLVAVVAASLAGLLLLVMAAAAWRRRQEPALEPVPAMAGTGIDLERLLVARDEAGAPLAPAVDAGVPEGLPVAPEEEVDLTQLLGEEFKLQTQPDPVRQKLREEIEKMVKQQPELVAQLMRAWISEEQ